MKNTVNDRIFSTPDAYNKGRAEAVMVLGAGVSENGTVSYILKDRLDYGIALYKNGSAAKILMSGDHGRVHYDEVNAMKDYAIRQGVPSEDIFMDHAGFSTYESMYRAKEIFGVQNMIVVTQRYHMYRALYIAEKMGIESYGVAADQNLYGGQTMRDIRELLAQCKDFFKTMLMPEPTYLGEAIPISGSGDATNDKQKTEEP
ncbi:MAG: YdcF family protein [Clostridia bacterium]|nr:YdcF family protein [Clostridia bacterium]